MNIDSRGVRNTNSFTNAVSMTTAYDDWTGAQTLPPPNCGDDQRWSRRCRRQHQQWTPERAWMAPTEQEWQRDWQRARPDAMQGLTACRSADRETPNRPSKQTWMRMQKLTRWPVWRDAVLGARNARKPAQWRVWSGDRLFVSSEYDAEPRRTTRDTHCGRRKRRDTVLDNAHAAQWSVV